MTNGQSTLTKGRIAIIVEFSFVNGVLTVMSKRELVIYLLGEAAVALPSIGNTLWRV